MILPLGKDLAIYIYDLYDKLIHKKIVKDGEMLMRMFLE